MSQTSKKSGSSRRRFLIAAAAMFAAAVSVAFTVPTAAHLNSLSDTQKETTMSLSSVQLPTPEGPGSVWGAPNLPAGFTDIFTSQYIDTGDVRLHAVIGGDGPPLLLIHGWPETWYAWRR